MTNTRRSTKTPDAEEFAKEPESTTKVQDSPQGYYNREILSKSERIKTLDALLKECNVDLNVWRVETHIVNSWEQHSTRRGLVTLFQIKAQLVRRAPAAVKPVASIGKPLKLKKRKNATQTALFMPDSQHGFVWGERHSSLIPLHDYLAIDVFVQMAIKLQPEYIILLGDHVDLAEWSTKYKSAPRHKDTTQPTLDVLRWHLMQLRVNCPSSKIIWLEGNHDARIERAFVDRMPQALNIKPHGETESAMSLPTLLKLNEIAVDYHGPYGTPYWLWDEIECTHGSSASIEGEARKAVHSRINGHVHRRGHATRTISTPNGIKRLSIVNPGTLARIDGEVVPSATVGKDVEDWQQGFALAHFIEGNAHFQVIPIEDGISVFDGEIIRGEDRVKQIAKETGWRQLVLR